MNITIRKEEERDYKKVYEVNRLAFQQENESKLIEKIRKGNNFVPDLSLVAKIKRKNWVLILLLFWGIKSIIQNLDLKELQTGV